MSLRIHASRTATNLLALFLALALVGAMLLAPASMALAAEDVAAGDTGTAAEPAEQAPADPPADASALADPATEPVPPTEPAPPVEPAPPAELAPPTEPAATEPGRVSTEPAPSASSPSESIPRALAEITPLIANTCDFNGFEVDGNLTAGDCAPGYLDWNTPGLGVSESSSTGTYGSQNKDRNDPSGWIDGGAGADQATFANVYAFSEVVDDDFLVYTGFTRTATTGTFGFTIEVTNAPEHVGNGVPQPDRTQGGTVFRVAQQGNGDITFVEACNYTSQTDYDSSCTTASTGFTWQTNNDGPILNPLDNNTQIPIRGFLEMGINVTELTGVQAGCPASASSTVYVRSWTGNDNNLQKWAGAIAVDPPSTCGSIKITKAAAPEGVTSTYDFGYTVDRTGSGPVVEPSTTSVTGGLEIGQTDTIVNVPPGVDFTLVEDLIPEDVPWVHTSTVCTVPGVGTYTLASSTSTFPVVERKTTTCVITNTTSMLTVTKIAIGQQDQAFGFDLDGVAGSDLSIVGTSAPGTTSTAILYKPNTQVTVTELLAAVNAGNGVGADWALQGISGGTVNLADLSTTVTTEAGSTVSVTFTNIQTASVVVDKQWVVNQVAYDHGAQPDGLDAALKLTGPGNEPASEQAWSEERTGYVVGDTVVISETTTIDPRMIGCTLTSSTITDPLGQTVPAAGYTLTQGKQTFTVTNTVDCDTDLTLVKEVVGGPAAAVDWTLTANGPGTATAGPTGPGTATGPVDPEVTYNLSETPGANTAARTALYRQQGTWACLALDAVGAPLDPQPTGWTDAPDASVTVLLGMHVRCTVTNATAQLTIFKAIEGGVLTPDMFELTATPAVMEGLAAESVGGGAPDDGAVADADGSSTFDVRPAHDYVLSEATPGNVNLAYIGLRLERWVNGNWEVVEDPSAAIQVPIGGHDFYRLVNAPPTPFALPLTGGIGSDLFGYGGGALLLATLLAAVAVVRRSTFMTARPGGRHV